MKTSRILSAMVILLVIFWNYFASALPLNDNELGYLSEKYSTLINPAPYAFSIWGLIYLGLLAFAVYQLVPKNRAKKWIDELNPLLIANLVLNALWLAFFHFELILASTICMLGILFTLIKIFQKTRIHRKVIPSWLNAIFQVYLGWISVATVVNVSLYLQELGLGQRVDSSHVWYFVILCAVLLLGLIITFRFRIIFYALTLAWALIAISFDQQGQSQAIALTPMFFGGALLLFGILLRPIKR